MPTKAPRYSSEEVLHSFQVEVNTFEELYKQEVTQGAIHDYHRTTFYHVFRYNGKGNVHYVEGKKILLGKDSLLIINRNVLHKYATEKCSGNMVLFTDTFLGSTQEKINFLNNSTLLQGSYVVIPMMSERFAVTVDFYFSQMRKLHIEKITDLPLSTAVILRNCLHNMLLTIEREYRLRNATLIAPSNNNSYMLQFKNLLDVHYQEQKQVAFYAEMLKISEKKLSLITHHVHGISAKTYINEKIVQEAIWLLKNTTLNQGEIADRLGLDFTYFVKFFRKHIGSTPAKHRHKLLA